MSSPNSLSHFGAVASLPKWGQSQCHLQDAGREFWNRLEVDTMLPWIDEIFTRSREARKAAAREAIAG